LKGKIFQGEIDFSRQPFFLYLSIVPLTFGFLCLASCLFEGLSYFLKTGDGIEKVIFPDSLPGQVNFIFGVMSAAFFEEVIYRFYLPQAFREIFFKFFKDKAEAGQKINLLAEGLALLLFALGHFYLGILGFFNALVCGLALRICMIKSKSLLIPFAVHTAYNFLSFLFYYLLFN
ncbi:MAG: CPBP family intramembrane metalloprotease, partial [Treponema sp.]|nr:CPBP family intramembrane metalloprotease [Treponema sp.]